MNKGSESRPRFCTSCGQPLAAGASFCRKCGTRTQPAASGDGEPPTQQLPRQKPPPAAAQPSAPPPRGTPSPSPPPRRQAPPPGQAPPPPPAGPRPRGIGKAVLAAALAGLLVGGGVAAAIVLLGDDDSGPAQVRSPGDAATVPAGEAAPTETGEADSSSSPGDLPTGDRAQMAQEIQSLLLAFHEDVVAERFRDAWSLLSVRKRSQTLREDGYRAWARAQASLSPYLSPAGLTVRVDALEDDDVARVLVTGMGWSGPGSSCSQWAGLTWVKYEAGVWTYDPGYSTTPERERAWKPRYDELLGASC